MSILSLTAKSSALACSAALPTIGRTITCNHIIDYEWLHDGSVDNGRMLCGCATSATKKYRPEKNAAGSPLEIESQ